MMKILVCSSNHLDIGDLTNQWDQIDGITNNHYFIPTHGIKKRRLHLDSIRNSIDDFILFACGHPEFNFLISPIGCSKNEYEPTKIAPMFSHVPSNCSLPYEFVQVLESRSNKSRPLSIEILSDTVGKEQLKNKFGHYYSTVEDLIRQHLFFICPESKSFEFQVAQISNGGLFIKIDSRKQLYLRHPASVKKIVYTSESASLIANHFVFNSLQQQIREPWIIDLCDMLDLYIQSSPQAQQIFLALR